MACSILGVLLAYQLFWYAMYSVLFKMTVYSQVVSPDGATIASVIQVDTGATDGSNRRVTLTPAHTLFSNRDIYNGNNTVMFLNGESDIHLSWHGSKNLVVDYRDNLKPDIDYQRSSWHGVSLTYLGAKKWTPPLASKTTTIIM